MLRDLVKGRVPALRVAINVSFTDVVYQSALSQGGWGERGGGSDNEETVLVRLVPFQEVGPVEHFATAGACRVSFSSMLPLVSSSEEKSAANAIKWMDGQMEGGGSLMDILEVFVTRVHLAKGLASKAAS